MGSVAPVAARVVAMHDRVVGADREPPARLDAEQEPEDAGLLGALFERVPAHTEAEVAAAVAQGGLGAAPEPERGAHDAAHARLDHVADAIRIGHRLQGNQRSPPR